MAARTSGKTIGRKPSAKAAPSPKPASKPKKPAAKTVGKPARGADARVSPEEDEPAPSRQLAPPPTALSTADQTLLEALATRTGLGPGEVLSRALQSYAAAVAPNLRPKERETAPGEQGRLFVSVDGRPERPIDQEEFILGSGPDCDLRLDLPLIAPRHARILRREGRSIFEDLNSGKGSYRQGQLVDVRYLEEGDEIDLGGFLPIRFRFDRGV